MKAVVVRTHGGPQALELTELPLDAPTLDSALSALSDAAESFGW
jgi:NADPH:quinone reductase-like Zn-dependent oxidoreductase